MTNTNTIALYHGGNRVLLDSIALFGLHLEQEFYCSRQQSLAEEAARSHGTEGAVLRIPLAEALFNRGIKEGWIEERLYMGCIQVEGAREVIVKKEGIPAFNQALLQGHP